jgi:hypothetical protein
MGSGSSVQHDYAFAELDRVLRAGDHIAVWCSLAGLRFTHHGIYVGGGECVQYHFTPSEGRGKKGLVRLTPIAEFGADVGTERLPTDRVWICAYPPPGARGGTDEPEQVVTRARALVGQVRSE